ncbi:hypothetical protein NITGR_290058 [Nitrospina gracilis 3/211]|uniref:Uncharacterized protein n=1 Tax=Nitrospina gracilis (strain 3/211) TaxID=1266370 RepID=M1YXP4_NITG3|nr:MULTISPECIES: hypothetical protein [Nitrospina]MCF8723399.1 hypothetical protein [Nitrospina sp. Nb-3]CCQ90459.1 hypothetical protein NITGR_290058 [Nitrospina gracilis 3/211]
MEPEMQMLVGLGFMMVAFIVSLIYMGILYTIIRYLKKYHFRKWKDLGSPSSLFGMGFEGGWRLKSFMSSGDYLYLRDERLSEIIANLKKVEKLFAVILIILVALVFCKIFISA